MLLASNREPARQLQNTVFQKKKPSGGIPMAFLEVSHRCPSTRSRAARLRRLRRNLLNCFLQAFVGRTTSTFRCLKLSSVSDVKDAFPISHYKTVIRQGGQPHDREETRQ